jgi:hypothetical protein
VKYDVGVLQSEFEPDLASNSSACRGYERSFSSLLCSHIATPSPLKIDRSTPAEGELKHHEGAATTLPVAGEPHGPSAIDDEDLTGNIPSVIRHQVEQCGRNISGLAGNAQRDMTQ